MDPKHCPIPVKIEDEMMIFPVKEKPILDYPYYEFYDLFRKEQWKKLLIIGYSFRDEPVNCAILDNFHRVKDAKMIVIDPKAEEIVRKVLDPDDGDMDRIITIEGNFGDLSVFDDLKLAVKCSSREVFRNELKDRDRRAKLSFH